MLFGELLKVVHSTGHMDTGKLSQRTDWISWRASPVWSWTAQSWSFYLSCENESSAFWCLCVIMVSWRINRRLIWRPDVRFYHKAERNYVLWEPTSWQSKIFSLRHTPSSLFTESNELSVFTNQGSSLCKCSISRNNWC